MSSDLQLPGELTARPLALVGLSGLNIESNTTHALIWNSFASTNRNERPPINFVLLGRNHSFPPAKPDRTSYEWYIPKGILKRKWMSKHLNHIPGIVALFYDLEWDDPSWKTKHAECAANLLAIRASLMGRGTKLCLVLIQNNPPLPSSEDALAADRAAALCQACELPPKSLFVLPCRSDHLQGYTLRLESAFFELCQSSYHLSSRAVRAHRDHLNRTNHGYLFVRHQFKIGFYHELKQDIAMAHKHYTQSYTHLLELRITDANVAEVKIVAGYIGYKVWRLSFMLNLPREAIAHFRSHLEFFRLRVGHLLSRFEHHAWLATQFITFGRLFEDAIDLGLPTIHTQHPGFYYQQAAQQAIQRKRACYQDYANLDPAINVSPTPQGESSQLEYYGQRPWRPNRLSLEPSDMTAETEGLACLLARDRLQGHIVGALTNAVNQFKNHRSPRMKQYLMVQMAEEYYRSANYAEALTLLEPLLWDYRRDLWWRPLTSLLQLGLRCAFLGSRPAEYFTFSFELCSRNAVNSVEEKSQMLDDLLAILDRRVPSGSPMAEVEPEVGEKAAAYWSHQLANLPPKTCVTTIVTNTIASFVQVKATFLDKQYGAHCPIEIEVHVRYSGPKTIQFASLSVALNNAAYLAHCQVKDPDELKFEPDQVRRYGFEFAAEPQDIGCELQITSATLELGKELLAYFRCEGGSNEDWHLSRHEFPSAGRDPLADIYVINSTNILPRSAKIDLKIEHDPPVLRGECYPIRLSLTSLEEEVISNLQLAASISGTGRIHDQPKIGTETSIKLTGNDIASGAKQVWHVFVQIEQAGKHSIDFQIDYQILTEICGLTKTYKSRYTATVDVESIQPIVCEAQYQSMQFQPLNLIPSGDLCAAVIAVSNPSPFPLLLDQGIWKFDPLLSAQSVGAQLSGLTLQPGEKANDMAVITVSDSPAQSLHSGYYSLKWKRANHSRADGFRIPYSASSYDLPQITTESVPLRIHVQLPAHGFVRQAMHAAYTLTNTSDDCLELDVTMGSNDAFMFAGNKQVKVSIFPGDDYVLMYNFYPLLAGFVALPPLQLKPLSPVNQSVIDELVNRYVPTHIFVLPQSKQSGDAR